MQKEHNEILHQRSETIQLEQAMDAFHCQETENAMLGVSLSGNLSYYSDFIYFVPYMFYNNTSVGDSTSVSTVSMRIQLSRPGSCHMRVFISLRWGRTSQLEYPPRW
jgi:hypothetical protein